MPDHLATLQSVYAAFGSGDVNTILANMSDDVAWETWEDNRAQRAGVAWMTARHGKEGVADFFSTLARTVRVTHFEIRDIIVGAKQAAVEFIIEGDVLATGAHYRDEEIHLWSYDDAGRITRLRHYIDTAKHIAVSGLV